MEGYIDVLRKQAIGGVIKYIKLGNLTEAIIELPSYEEQKEVVEILDKLKGIIDNETQRIRKYDDLIKARFVEMFGDPVQEVCQKQLCQNWESLDAEFLSIDQETIRNC